MQENVVTAEAAKPVVAVVGAGASQEVAVHEAAGGGVKPFLAGYDGPTGAENIESKDITIPRIKIAQAISEEVKNDGMREGSCFLNVTGQAIWSPGDDPLPCLVIGIGKEHVIWRDRDFEGGGILDRARPMRDENGHIRYAWSNPNQSYKNRIKNLVDVVWNTKTYTVDIDLKKGAAPLDDEDTLASWGTEIPGNLDSGPAAGAHHNYLLLLPTIGNVVAALTMSRTGVKVARGLNGAIKMGASARTPLPMLKFNLTTFDDISKKGDPFKNWSIKPAGKLLSETGQLIDPNDAALATLAMGYFKSFQAGNYVVDLSDAKVPGNADMGDEEVPF